MANFNNDVNINPDYGIRKVSSPKVRVVKMGDGYEQRLAFGLNQNLKEYSVSFKNLPETDADTIETFLDARAADNQSFTWTPPGESAASKFVCIHWTKTIPFANRATIKTMFKEVAEP